MYNKTNKSFILMITFLLCGLVIGGLLGKYIGSFKYLEWLNYGKTFGFVEPLVLDLSVIVVKIGISVSINVCAVIGIVIGIIMYKRI